jgi:hypothetical protein
VLTTFLVVVLAWLVVVTGVFVVVTTWNSGVTYFLVVVRRVCGVVVDGGRVVVDVLVVVTIDLGVLDGLEVVIVVVIVEGFQVVVVVVYQSRNGSG